MVVTCQDILTVHSNDIQSWSLLLHTQIWPRNLTQLWDPLNFWRDSDLGFWKSPSGRFRSSFVFLHAQSLDAVTSIFSSSKIYGICGYSTLRHIWEGTFQCEWGTLFFHFSIEDGTSLFIIFITCCIYKFLKAVGIYLRFGESLPEKNFLEHG